MNDTGLSTVHAFDPIRRHASLRDAVEPLSTRHAAKNPVVTSVRSPFPPLLRL
jgi:hypothetical protein